MNDGLQGASIWCLCRQNYPGYNFMDYGLWEYKDQSFQPRPVCFAYGMFLKYLKADDTVGSLTVQGNGLVSGSVVAREAKSEVVYLLNRADHSVHAAIEGATPDRYDLYLYSSDPLKTRQVILLAPERSVIVAGDGTATLDLPANSFTTLIEMAPSHAARDWLLME
jgi:hypothetical protein